MSARRSLGHAALALLGLGLLALFVGLSGPHAILAHLRKLGAGMGLLLAVAAAWRCLETSAMRRLFPRDARPGWAVLFAVRTFGESLNALTPLMGLGGEPIKAMLLQGHLARGESGTGYVLLDKTVFFVASVLFMLSGMAVALWLVRGQGAMVAAGSALSLAWLVLLAWLGRLQARGRLVTGGVRMLARLGLRPSPTRAAQLERVGETLQRAYHDRPAQLWVAVGVHFVGRAVRVLDVWLCAALLGLEVGWGAAYVVAAAGTLVGAAFAFIPGALGAYEGGQALVLAQFGVDMAGGVSLGLVRHLRNWMFAALAYTGLYFVARRQGASATAQASAAGASAGKRP